MIHVSTFLNHFVLAKIRSRHFLPKTITYHIVNLFHGIDCGMLAIKTTLRFGQELLTMIRIVQLSAVIWFLCGFVGSTRRWRWKWRTSRIAWETSSTWKSQEKYKQFVTIFSLTDSLIMNYNWLWDIPLLLTWETPPNTVLLTGLRKRSSAF